LDILDVARRSRAAQAVKHGRGFHWSGVERRAAGQRHRRRRKN
jgi:hypothetical protein